MAKLSNSDVDDSTSRLAAKTIELLKEYTQKLRLFKERVYKALDSSKVPPQIWISERNALAPERANMRPALQHLARQASQLIEHSGIDASDLIEIRLRLAEFETALQAVDQLQI